MKSDRKDDVPQGSPPVGEPRQWVEQRARLSPEANGVWTDRMLEALVKGVKGGQWYSLMDKVCDPKHLWRGAWQVIRNDGAAGIDHRSCEQLEKELSTEVELLSRRLREGTYQPTAVKRVWIDKAGSPEKRPLGIPTVRDRVVQATLLSVIEPIFEMGFASTRMVFGPDVERSRPSRGWSNCYGKDGPGWWMRTSRDTSTTSHKTDCWTNSGRR